jgi:Macrocin-O-methyltransferase (TylF)
LSLDYMEVGRWMRAKGYTKIRRFVRREELFDRIGDQIASHEVLCMEFGVFEGETIRYWSKLLLNPKSKLHGFDRFEGLPENWLPDHQKGNFATDGVIPQIDDDRVKFFKGWFEDTLPKYSSPSHEVLDLTFDADLYSSTIFALRTIKDQIIPGTYLFFDEFNVRRDELRAFDEFINETGKRFSLVGATRILEHVVFRCEG